MSINTFRLTVDLLRPDGSAIANALVTAALTKADVSLTEGQIGKVMLEATSDDHGSAVLQLWPNTGGTHGSQYRIKALDPETGVKLVDALVTMPANDCHLRDILMSPAPTPKPYDEASINAVQQYRIEAGNHKADAEAAAASAAESVQQAADKVNEAAGSVTATNQIKDAVEALKDTAVQASLQVLEYKTTVEAHRLVVDQAKELIAESEIVVVQKAQEVASAGEIIETSKTAAVAAGSDAIAARNAAQASQTAAEQHEDASGSHAQLASDKAAEAQQSANTSSQVERNVVSERVLVTQMREQCDQFSAATAQNKSAAETAAGSAANSAQSAQSAETEAAQHKADAEAARDASVAAAESYAGQLAQMATDITNLETLLVQQNG